jgi:hypothetical protein
LFIICFFRVLICNGIIKIFWKYLSSPLFDCHVNCDAHGNIIIGAAAQEGGEGNNSSCCFLPSSLMVCFHLHNSQHQLKEKDFSVFKELNPLSATTKRMSLKRAIRDVEDPHSSSTVFQFDKTNQTVLQAAINQKIIWFVRFGYALLFIGVVMNILWIYLLFQISNNIEYQPLTSL